MINNKTARECYSILLRYFHNDIALLSEMLLELSKVKSNQSFHDSIHLLYDMTLQAKDKM